MNAHQLWQRIRETYSEDEEYAEFEFAAPATDSEIELLTETVGELPAEFIESLKVHNGCTWLLGFGELLSIEGLIQQWNMYSEWQSNDDYGKGPSWSTDELKGPVKPYWWGQKRIYVTDNSGDHVTLDLDPPGDGTYGQLIKHCHEVGPKYIIANGWFEFLKIVPDFMYAEN